MTSGNYLALCGILVSAAVALLVSHLHRKQMRQVELFKIDPSVGLIPPPSSFTVFLREKGPDVLIVSLPLVLIINEMMKEGQVTRGSVLTVSLSVALIFAYATVRFVFALVRDVVQMIKKVVGLMEQHIEATKDIQKSRISALEARLKPEA